jgi:WD40 repeat protein
MRPRLFRLVAEPGGRPLPAIGLGRRRAVRLRRPLRIVLTAASGDHTIRLWDTEKGRCLRVFKGHTDEVFAATFYHDVRRRRVNRDRTA